MPYFRAKSAFCFTWSLYRGKHPDDDGVGLLDVPVGELEALLEGPVVPAAPPAAKILKARQIFGTSRTAWTISIGSVSTKGSSKAAVLNFFSAPRRAG